MNILFLSAHYPPRTRGGGEISTHLIAQGLIKRGHKLRVITEGLVREKAVVDGVPVLRLPIKLTAKPLLEKRHGRKLARALRAELGDDNVIVHAHDFRTALVLGEMNIERAVVTMRDYAAVCGTTNAILPDGKRCTCSWHDVMRLQRVREAAWPRKFFRVWQYKYNIGYRRALLGGIKNQIFISAAQLDEISAQLDLTKINKEVIYNPVSDDYLSDRPGKSVQGNVLYLGTIEDYKGVRLLIEAWREIVKLYPQAKLKIIGQGAQRLEYEKLVDKWGMQYKVNFVGRLPWGRLRQYYDEAQVVVAPHIWREPFGRTVVEAMARGKLVVAAGHGGPGEIITDNKTGLLFETGSLEALQKRLIDTLNMSVLRRREIEQAARQWAGINLKTDIIAAKYEKFYQELRLV